MDAANPFLRFGAMLVVALLAPTARAHGVSELQLSPITTAEDRRQSHAQAALPTAKETPQDVPTPSLSDPNAETVTERYPNGNIKIQRQVVKDAAENYVNQGTYTQYDLAGKVQKTGQFLNGKPQGKWTQTVGNGRNGIAAALRRPKPDTIMA